MINRYEKHMNELKSDLSDSKYCHSFFDMNYNKKHPILFLKNLIRLPFEVMLHPII